MKHDIAHDLDHDTAKLVARKAVEAYAQRFADYDFKSSWPNENRVELSFAVAGKRLKGAMDVETSKLVFQMDVPFVFRVFSGKAIKIIESEAQKWIQKARDGELKE